MPRSNELKEKRNRKIYDRYKELYNVNYIQHKRVLELLSEEFFLVEITIERIVLAVKKTTLKHEKNRQRVYTK